MWRLKPSLVHALRTLPEQVQSALALDKQIQALAEEFANKSNSLFLGRGSQYPIAMEERSSSRRSAISTPKPMPPASSKAWPLGADRCRYADYRGGA